MCLLYLSIAGRNVAEYGATYSIGTSEHPAFKASRLTMNILFISADQWRSECLSLLGHPVVKTPHLDALAKDSVCFTQHFCQSAPCGPARASMLTGQYAMNHRSILNGTPLDARHSNIAKEARKLGYDPTLFGYTDTSPDPRLYPPNDPALTTYEGVMPGFSVGMQYAFQVPLAWVGYLKNKGYAVPDTPFDAYLGQADYPGAAGRGHAFAAPIYRAEDSDTAFTADKTIEYLQLHRHRPWFAHVVFLRPHPPLYAPEPYNSLYDPAAIRMPARAGSPGAERGQHPFLDYWLSRQAETGAYSGHPAALQNLPDHEIRQMIAAYYGLISEVDYHIGRLLDYLRANGEYDKTLIIFTCDHGEQLGEHWLWGKGGYFDASYHIPLIIRDPRTGAARNRRVDAFTEAVDIMPTVLDWLGAEIPVQCDGRSLLPWLQDDSPPAWRDTVHWEFDFRHPLTQQAEQALDLSSDQCTLNVIRDRYYKYVHFTALPPLFFDLRRDALEFDNKADDPDYRDRVLHYAQKLLSLRMAHAERTLSNTLLSDQGVVEYRGERYNERYK